MAPSVVRLSVSTFMPEADTTETSVLSVSWTYVLRPAPLSNATSLDDITLSNHTPSGKNDVLVGNGLANLP